MSDIPFKPEIETERLRLLRLMPEDAPLVFYGWASKDRATRFLAWPTHTAIEDTLTFLTAARSAWRTGRAFVFGLRLARSNRLIGSLGLHRQENGTFELGYVLSPLFWKQGYAGEAVFGMLRALANTGIHELSAVVHPDNQASIVVLERTGFKEILEANRLCVFPNISPSALKVRTFRWRDTEAPAAC